MATSNATPTNTPVDTVKAAVAKVAAKTRAVKKPAVKARPVKAAAVKAPAKTAAKTMKKVAAKAPTLKQVAHKGTRKVTSVVHMTRDASFKLIDSQRSIWLAGLGPAHLHVAEHALGVRHQAVKRPSAVVTAVRPPGLPLGLNG
jgi:hypothetical protein